MDIQSFTLNWSLYEYFLHSPLVAFVVGIQLGHAHNISWPTVRFGTFFFRLGQQQMAEVGFPTVAQLFIFFPKDVLQTSRRRLNPVTHLATMRCTGTYEFVRTRSRRTTKISGLSATKLPATGRKCVTKLKELQKTL